MGLTRLLPLSGIVFVVVTIVAFTAIGGSTPDAKDSPDKIASFYGAHHSKETAAAYVVTWAVPFLVFFGISLATALWLPGGGASNIWQRILIAGTAVAAAGFLATAAVHLALADGGNHHYSTLALQALNGLDADIYPVFTSGLGIMLLGAAGSMIPQADRWLGWIALVLGIAIFTPLGFFALLGSGVWIIATSLVLFMRRAGDTGAASQLAT